MYSFFAHQVFASKTHATSSGRISKANLQNSYTITQTYGRTRRFGILAKAKYSK